MKTKNPRRKKIAKATPRYVVSYGEMGCQEILDTKTHKVIDGVSDAQVINSMMKEANRLDEHLEAFVSNTKSIDRCFQVLLLAEKQGRTEDVKKQMFQLASLLSVQNIVAAIVYENEHR